MPRSAWFGAVTLLSKHIVLLLVVGLLFSGVFRLLSQEAPIPAEYADLVAAVRQDGTVSVIVGLSTPSKGAGGVGSQALGIQQAQQSILANLVSEDVSAVSTYETVPFMALTVDEAGLRALIASGEVTSIEPDRVWEPYLATAIPLIGADDVWTAGYDGTGQTIAIIDTGVEASHPTFGGRVVDEACFSTDNGTTYESTCANGLTEQFGAGAAAPCSVSGCDHGTHVAGIAAGEDAMYSGVAKDANILAVQASSVLLDCTINCARFWNSDLMEALEWVYDHRLTYNIASVNMSLGGGQYFDACDSSGFGVEAVIDNLVDAGIAVIAASGNDSYSAAMGWPACLSTTISVGASTDADVVANFSNSSFFLDLLAPGSSITSSVPGGGIGTKNGTSMATPMVAGAWALLRDANPNASIESILWALRNTGKSITDEDNGLAAPRIQVDVAVDTIMIDGLPVLISEVRTANAQYVELYNASNTTADLTGWSLELYGANDVLEKNYIFPASTLLSAGNYLTLYRGTGTSSATTLYMGDFATSWDEYADGAVQLVSDGGISLDFVRWGDSEVAPLVSGAWLAGSAGVTAVNSTIGRAFAAADLNKGQDFYPNTGTPGGQNLVLLPSNDNIAAATEIDVLDTVAVINTHLATVEVSEVVGSCNLDWQRHSVWYTFTLDTETEMTVSTLGSDYDTVLAVWSGSPSSLVEQACNDDVFSVRQSLVEFTALPNETYYIQVAGWTAASGMLKLTVTQALNDEFADARAILSVPHESRVLDASPLTTSPSDPTPSCDASTEKTAWYRIALNEDVIVLLDTVGSDYDTVLSVWTGEENNLTKVPDGCNDDVNAGGGDYTSQIDNLLLNDGETYYVMIARGDAGGGDFLQFNVVVQNFAPTASNNSYTIMKNGSLNVSAPGVLADDNDPEAQPLTATLVDDVSSGTLDFNANGSFDFVPAQDFVGVVSFIYLVNDGVFDSNEATVTITVEETPTPQITDEPSVTSTPTPQPGTEIPSAPVDFHIEANQGRPTIYWQDDVQAEWFNIWIGGDTQVHYEWYPRNPADAFIDGQAAVTCAEGVCSVTPDINPLAGSYQVWMQFWGQLGFSTGGNTTYDGWSMAEFTLLDEPPPAVSGMTVAVGEGGDVTFSWNGAQGATWYNIWIGTTDFEQQLFDWVLAENLGCENAEVCTLQSGVDLYGATNVFIDLSSGEYLWYVRSWGPGGFSIGGIQDAPQWAQGEGFVVP